VKQAVEHLRNAVPIAFGTALYAFGLHYFVIPNELMEGGVTGIAVLLYYAFGLSPAWMTLVLNIPLFWIGWRVLGKGAMAYTVFGTLCVAFFLWVTERLVGVGLVEPFKTSDYLLAALYAGLALGTGIGIVFRFGGTTGGVDIIARVLHKWKGWSMGQMILVIDSAVIGSSLLYLPKEKVLYTLVAVFVATRVIDYIAQGGYEAKAFTVVTDRADAIAERILHELDRGATLLPAVGAYSGKNRHIVYCVVYRHEVRRLRQIVRAVDPGAFIIISDVADVLGEGFRPE